MRCLLDTNVISETAKPAPEQRVVQFLARLEESSAFLSVVTLAELKFGVEKLSKGARRERLQAWLEHDIPARFEGRILGIDTETAAEWGRIMARAEKLGRPLSEMDGWIAASSTIHALVLVTRNVGDFSGFEGRILNPWET